MRIKTDLKRTRRGAALASGLWLAVALAGPALSSPTPPLPDEQADERAGSTQSTAPQAIVLTPVQLTALNIVMDPEGFITEDLHRAFWRDLPDTVTGEPIAADGLAAGLERTITAATRFQREIWRSARRSLAAGEVEKSPGFEAARAAALTLVTGYMPVETIQPDTGAEDIGTGSGPNSNSDDASDHTGDDRDGDRGDGYDAWRRAAQSALTQADALLFAAANKAPLPSPSGPVPVTQERITGVLSRLDSALARLDLLLKPDYTPRPVARPYQDAGVVLTWPTPFAVDRIGPTAASQSDPNGSLKGTQGAATRQRVTGSTTLTNRTGPDSFLFVTAITFSGSLPDGKDALERLVRSALAQAGGSEAQVEPAEWQGRRAAVGEGRASDGKNRAWASAMAIPMPERRMAITLTALSGTSAGTARDLREDLENALALLPLDPE